MTRQRETDRELERRLREAEVPDEAGAEQRAWELVRAAHAERTPVRPSRSTRRWAFGGAAALVALAIGLSPAGAKVGDLVSDVTGIGEEHAKPELRSLPAAGELLVESPQGPWVVQEDGSKRLLGDYRDATWSPHGRYVAAADGHQLVALDPEGGVQWTLPTSGPPTGISWEGSLLNTRIAYRVGDDLHIVGGDGEGDRTVATDVGPGQPLWLRQPGLTKVDPELGTGFPYVLAYPRHDAAPAVIDPNTDGRVNVHVGRAHQRQLDGTSVPSPVEHASASIVEHRRRATVTVHELGRGSTELFSARGRLTGPTWSPDGRWLLVGWPAADQWLFIEVAHPKHVIPFGHISEQFDPGGSGAGAFPRVSGWVLPEP